MRAEATIPIILAVLLAGCAHRVDRPVPVQVPVAVATPCPVPSVGSAGEPPALALDGVSDDTPIDLAANAWKASVLQLQAYVQRLRTEVADVRSALDECTRERP